VKFNLIDIGSRGVALEPWRERYVNHILTADPEDVDGKKTLAAYSGKRFHYPIAISDIPGKRGFNLCRKSRVSSLYEPDLDVLKDTCYGKNLNRWKISSTVEIECRRLDDILDELNIKFNFLKVDAQGADLDVLKSAGEHLQDIKGIQVECNLLPIYKGAPLAGEIDAFLEDKGFVLVKRWSGPKRKVWEDHLFINREASSEEKRFIRTVYKKV